MNWQAQYQQASFKGVSFYVDSSDTKIGRNLSTNEYPGTEDVSTEDISRKARSFSLDCYVLGSDYFQQRDALIAAFESKGAGELVHPYQGIQQVHCEDCNIKESKLEGGIAKFTVTFIEAGEQKFPAIEQDRNFQLLNKANRLNVVADSYFTNNVKLVNVPDYVRNGSINTVSNFFTNIKGLVNSGGLFNSLSSLANTDFIQSFANLSLNLDNVITPLASIKQSPLDYVSLISSTFGLIFDIGENAKSIKKILVPARSTTVDTIYEYTQQNKDFNSNQTVSTHYINLVGVATEAKGLTKQDFSSRKEALEVRDNLVDQIDLLKDVHQDRAEIYTALRDLKSEVIISVPNQAQRLPRIRNLKLPRTKSSILLAYDLYEDISQADDIVSRNKIKHPGFISGDKELEILVNE